MDLSLVLEESPDSQIDILLGQFVATPAGVIAYANAASAAAASANLSMTNAGVSAAAGAGSATASAASAAAAATSASNSAGSASAAAASATSAAASASLVTNAAAEVFVSGTGFTPGVTTSITLAGSYGSINNVLVLFDNQIQNDCTLVGHVLTFNPNVPVGVSQVVVRGGRALAIATPADGSVVDTSVAAGTKLYNRINGSVNVKDPLFGAKGDGVTDDTAAFNLALASSATVIYAPAGTYNIAGTIAFTQSNKKLIGDGEFLTILSSSSVSLPVITINNANFLVIEGIGVGSSVTATTGGDGIVFLTISEYSRLSRIHVTKRYDGIVLSNADVANAETIICDLNQRHGMLLTNASSYGASQWELTNILCGQNGGDGINVTSVAGPAGLIVGSWNSIKTYANSGYGISLNGSPSCPVFDLRATNMFLGSDGTGCINFASYGGNHRISGMFERAGLDPTGPTGLTPATHTAQNITIGPNEIDVSIDGSNIQTAAENGIYIAGGVVTVSGSSVVSNGVAAVSGQQNGIALAGGSLNISGSNVTGNQHAISASVDNTIAVGCNFASTSTPLVGPFTTNSSIVGCMPAAVINQLQGGLVLGSATGGNLGNATLNAGAGVFKNNVAYNNP